MAPSLDDLPLDTFQRVLEDDLQNPVYLTPEEVAGGWRSLFPELESCLPSPYPIFGRDEERIVTFGFPVLVSPGIERLRKELERVVQLECEYRLTRGDDKAKVIAQRSRYLQSLSTILENTFVNAYGRGLTEVFLLFHSGDVIRALGQVPKIARMRVPTASRSAVESTRQSIAGICADLIQRASVQAVDALKRLADLPITPRTSPLLGVMCSDQLLLSESRPPADLTQLAGYLRARFRQDAGSVAAACNHVLRRLRELVQRQPELEELLGAAAGIRLDLDRPQTLLEPKLLDALERAGLTEFLDLSRVHRELLRELGRRLKTFELLATLRRRILPMEVRGGDLVLCGPSSATPIAPSSRPFDFGTPGVVESAVRRFGLVYDLTNFTALYESVRKAGHRAEENALRLMYVFQGQLETIRTRRRLNFEKFLGDGAFYSSRRALRVIAAACEIQRLYDRLRDSGFPFDQGIRIAMNYSTYHLLPLLGGGTNGHRFEFFGHGVVELARLTTGKSSREIDDIAEFLVHSGYNTAEVDAFLGPLLLARSGQPQPSGRRYAAAIDARGELVNEGMVLTLPFLEQLEHELELTTLSLFDAQDARWVLFPVDPGDPNTLHVGLRALGTARLKGLAPMELVEATVWTEVPPEARAVTLQGPLVALLRRLAQQAEASAAEAAAANIPENLAVLTYLEADGRRRWIFGQYRDADDVLLHAIQMPLQTNDLADDEPIEMWLFRHRGELCRLYDGYRNEASGLSLPMSTVRSRRDYLACFLNAPHKAPG